MLCPGGIRSMLSCWPGSRGWKAVMRSPMCLAARSIRPASWRPPSLPNMRMSRRRRTPGQGISGESHAWRNVRPRDPAEVTYQEGVYVGYRYYSTFHVKPAYEFGYGLSYTSFSYSDLKLSSPTFAGTSTATVTVTNTGNFAGKEVVELYLSAPATKLDKPVEELRAFGKTGLLKPGQSQTLGFLLDSCDLASFDTPSCSWVAEGGQYTVKIGASAADIKRRQFHAACRSGGGEGS